MSGIKKVTAIAEMQPDGQMITAAAVEYDTVIENDSVSAGLFEVKDRTVLDAYANDEPRRSKEGKDGSYVILELSLADKNAPVIYDPGKKPQGPPPPKSRPVPTVTVTQTGPIRSTYGELLVGLDGAVDSTDTYEPVVDQFELKELDNLQYYLFTPKGAKQGGTEKYPLVLFMTDIGANGTDYRMALSQGIGGTVWATEEDQKKHPCFVVVPQFPFMQVMNDDFTFDPIFNKVKKIVDYVADTEPVDRDRIYTTGQSQGCMASCELNVEYPDYFAASLLIAGQWDPQKMKETCAKNQFWILVSEKDDKASAGMDEVTAALEEGGAKVGRYLWDAKVSPEEQQKNVEAALADDVNVRYTKFSKDSVLPDGVDKPMYHAATWPVAYNIPGVRDWLFTCRRRTEGN